MERGEPADFAAQDVTGAAPDTLTPPRRGGAPILFHILPWTASGTSIPPVALLRPVGAVEKRTLTRSTALRDSVDWADLAQAFKLVRERTIRGTTTTETSYGIMFLPPDLADATTLLCLTRQHWGIENRVFHVRDVTWGEDHCRVHTGCAPMILSTLRNIALNLLRWKNVSNIAAAFRRPPP